jgi:hypothetical protein
MNKQTRLSIFTGVLIIPMMIGMAGCKGDGSDTGEVFKPDTIRITDAYPVLEEEVIPIMEQLEMCTTIDTVTTLPPCNNKYFQVFKYRANKDWLDGFMVEMIPGLFGAPVHQVVIIENNFGKYQIINQYYGHLLEMRSTPSGYHDLLIGYEDPDIGVVGIRHEWIGTKYDVVDVEEIDGHLVLPEYKDSINNIFLPAFSAGY